jgi:hypothetical protein
LKLIKEKLDKGGRRKWVKDLNGRLTVC